MPEFVPYTDVLIIRVWDEAPTGSGQLSVWRYMVEDVESMKRFYFSSSDQLMAFLMERIGHEETT
jgi:hypothetical protein